MKEGLKEVLIYLLKGLFIIVLKVFGGYLLLLSIVNLDPENIREHNSFFYNLCSAYVTTYFFLFITSVCIFISYKIDEKVGLFEIVLIIIDLFILISAYKNTFI